MFKDHIQRRRFKNAVLTSCLFVCLFVLRYNVPVNIFFSHVGMELPGYYQYFRGINVLLKDITRRREVSNPRPLAPESDILPLSHRAPFNQL